MPEEQTMTISETLAMVDKERAELEDIYYRLDHMNPNDDVEEMSVICVEAIDARKALILKLQQENPQMMEKLKLEPEDRRN